jgi:sortase A
LQVRERSGPIVFSLPVTLYRTSPPEEDFGPKRSSSTTAAPRSRRPRPPRRRPAKKQRRVRFSQRPVYKRRRRTALLLVLVLLATLVYTSERADIGQVEQVIAPTSEQAPELVTKEMVTEEEAGEEEEAADEEKAANGEEVPEEDEVEEAAAPEDPTLYLSIPKLGMRRDIVRNENSEYALGLGAIKLPDTPFPWEKGTKNTYIACHRLGFYGTQSFHQCLDLPSMQKGDEVSLEDANGRVYQYRVSEVLTSITPEDSWVMDAVAGRDMISLQTCLEAPGDLHTLGPDWQGRLIVRADRVV